MRVCFLNYLYLKFAYLFWIIKKYNLILSMFAHKLNVTNVGSIASFLSPPSQGCYLQGWSEWLPRRITNIILITNICLCDFNTCSTLTLMDVMLFST